MFLPHPSPLTPRPSCGFSTIELLIAMALGIIILSGVIAVSAGNQSQLVGGATNGEADAFAKYVAQDELAKGRQDYDLVNPTTSTKTLSGITYTQATTVTLLADYVTKQVQTIVSWVGEHGQALSTTFTSLVTDTGNPSSPSACSSSMTNPDGWKSPADTPFDFQQLLYGNNSNGLTLSSIYAHFGRLYVVASSPPANPNDDETFFILDITGSTPVFLGSLDNDADNGSKYGLNDVAAATKGSNVYAYGANNDDNDFTICTESDKCSQLQVFNATNPAAPTVLANYKLPSAAAPYAYGNNPSRAGEAVGNAVTYANDFVYLGLTKTQNGPAFHVINVSDPAHPAWVGSWPASSIAFGTSGAGINSITIKGHYAYLSHPAGLVGAPGEQLTVLDVSDPAHPVRVSGYTSSGGAAGAAGKSAYAVGNTLYFGRTASDNASADSIPEMYMLDVSDPTAIPAAALGSKALAIDEGINNLMARDFLTFLLTTKQFLVLNTGTPSSITTWGSLALPGHGGSSFDCDHDRFFIIHDVNKDYVSIITPSAPVDYALANTGNISVNPGGSGNTTITRTVVSGSSPITLSPSALPAGATATFTNNPCSPTCSSTLTITTTASTPAGTYPITVHGSPNGTSNPSTTFNLVVNAPFDYTLSNNGPITIAKNSTGPVTITRTLVSGATTVVDVSSVSGLPAHTSVQSITNNPCGPTCSSSITIRVLNSAASGSYPITVTGSPSGTGPRTTTFQLIIP